MFFIERTMTALSFYHPFVQIIVTESLLCVGHWFRSWGYVAKDGTLQNDKELTHNFNTE